MQDLIKFNNAEHTYRKSNDSYLSATSLIKKVKNEFDKDHWSKYTALKKLLGPDFREKSKGYAHSDPALIIHLQKFVPQKDFHRATTEVLNEWALKNKIAITRGNNYHNMKETQAYDSGVQVNPFTNELFEVGIIAPPDPNGDKIAINRDLYNLPDGYYPELLLWNDEYGIAGTADKVFIETVNNVRYVDVDDYKTNNKIRKSNKFQKLKSPVDRLDDVNYNHYRLQVSLYAWMLEQFGFKVRNTAFTHFNKQYKFRYMRKDIVNILNYYKDGKI